MAVKLIVTHIPKTGGVTLRRMLLPHFRGVVNPWDRVGTSFESTGGQRLLRSPERLRGYIARKIVYNSDFHAEVLMGHIPVTVFSGYFPTAPRITWLRNPVDRVISAYYWWKKQGYIPEDERLEYFVERPEQQNRQAYYVNGNLSQFAFVGILERKECDFPRLAAFLGIPYVYPGKHNVTKNKPTINAALCHRISDLNILDWGVYNEATSR